MQVTSLLSQHEHKHDAECGCGHDHEHANVGLRWMLTGLALVINAFVVDWLFDRGGTVASVSAFFGSLILGVPIVVTAVKDLRRGRMTINELVAIAVLAAVL
jgi:Cd2+/Zn2+-exporting ATPase